MTKEKYTLVGVDGNAFFIMGYVLKCMRKEKKSQEEVDTYLADAQSSNYDHLLTVSGKMIEELNKL